MRKLLILVLMIFVAHLSYSKDYNFIIANYNDATEVLTATELNYSGTKVTVIYSWGYIGNMTKNTYVNSLTKRLELDKDGILWFIDDAGKKVAGVFSTNSGSEGFIAFLGEDGSMKKTKPSDVDTDFIKNYKALRAQTGESSASSSKNQQSTQTIPTSTLREAPLSYWFEHPFGVSPKWGTNSQDYVNMAKSQYGLDIKGGMLSNLEAQIHWPNYDCMSFLGYPIEYLSAIGNNELYEENDSMAQMDVNFIADRKDEQKVMNDLEKYMTENGWEKLVKGSHTYYCKGNTIVSAYLTYSSKDKNKAVVCVGSKIYGSKSAFEKAKAKL